ncbi:unnamed protein product [Arabidopsis halleri]
MIAFWLLSTGSSPLKLNDATRVKNRQMQRLPVEIIVLCWL